MSYAADDSNAIALRLKEIEKEKQERVTGSVHIQHDAATGETLEYKMGEYVKSWPMYAAADFDGA